MIDEFVRQERVQHHLDRRIGRGRIDQVGALDADQIFVVDGVERAQLAHRRQPHRDNPFRPDAAMSAPEDLTRSTSASSPRRSRIVVFSEVLPPPCRTSFGSRPSSRVV